MDKCKIFQRQSDALLLCYGAFTLFGGFCARTASELGGAMLEVLLQLIIITLLYLLHRRGYRVPKAALTILLFVAAADICLRYQTAAQSARIALADTAAAVTGLILAAAIAAAFFTNHRAFLRCSELAVPLLIALLLYVILPAAARTSPEALPSPSELKPALPMPTAEPILAVALLSLSDESPKVPFFSQLLRFGLLIAASLTFIAIPAAGFLTDNPLVLLSRLRGAWIFETGITFSAGISLAFCICAAPLKWRGRAVFSAVLICFVVAMRYFSVDISGVTAAATLSAVPLAFIGGQRRRDRANA